MRFSGAKVTDIHIAYIGGGSKGWAWGLMNDLVLESQISGDVRLFDIDLEAACDNEKIGNSLSGNTSAVSEWQYKAVETLEEALMQADFVIISILPGTLREMESDVHAPEKLGIYQSVGDTTGPGGIIRSLRTIPMYAEIAEAIKIHCPEAWVINYTNPMTLCTRTLYQVFPQIKAFGCCHEVFSTQELFVRLLKEFRDVEDVSRKDISTNVLGINHFTWIDKAAYKGMDLITLFTEFTDKYYEQGFEGPLPEASDAYFASGQRVKMDLFKRYGIIAAAGDRHLAEFCPPWYLKNPETVKTWQFRQTPVSYRFQELEKRTAKAKSLASGEEKWEIYHSQEEGVLQMKALLGLHDMVTNVNLPNLGQITGIPFNSVVETNVLISRDSIIPLIAGKLPDDVNSLVMRQITNQETILKAGLNKDKELAFRAFANDALMTASIQDARKLYIEMLENSKKYLQDWK